MTIDRTRFKTMLKKNGLKVTNQRVEVLAALEGACGKHLTAEEIYDRVKCDFPEIGLATVYRTLQIFLELGLIDKVNLNDGYVRYEMVNEDKERMHHHHHLVCLKCGAVFSFEDDLLDELEGRIEQSTKFHVIDHEVKFYGYCEKCGIHK